MEISKKQIAIAAASAPFVGLGIITTVGVMYGPIAVLGTLLGMGALGFVVVISATIYYEIMKD